VQNQPTTGIAISIWRSERYRGLDDHEDHLHAGTFHAQLQPGSSVTFVVSAQPDPELNGPGAFEARRTRERVLIDLWTNANPSIAREAPAWVKQLVLAADQFVVSRPLPDDPEALSVIAGYHWFGDWVRDTMIDYRA
jgi:glycogen debranching enzyme